MLQLYQVFVPYSKAPKTMKGPLYMRVELQPGEPDQHSQLCMIHRLKSI